MNKHKNMRHFFGLYGRFGPKEIGVSVLFIAMGIVVGGIIALLPEKQAFFLVVIGGGGALLALAIGSVHTVTWTSAHRVLLYLVLMSGFLGPTAGTIAVGSVHIFPYRILVLGMWALFLGQRRIKTAHIYKVKNYLIFLTGWMLYAILSLLWARSTYDAVRHIFFLFTGVSVIFFVVYYFSNIQDMVYSYYLWLFILMILIAVGLWETITGHHLNVSGLNYLPFRYTLYAKYTFLFHMPSAVFRNPNDFATYLALSLPFVLAFLRHQTKIIPRVIGITLLGGALYLIIKTLSRANYLASIVELAFFFVFLFKAKTKLKAAILSVLCILAFSIIFPKPAHRIVGTLNEQITSLGHTTGNSLTVRLHLIENSFVFLERTAGFGVGAGNAEYWMANFPIYDTGGVLNPHNWWVEILTDYGIFIFVGYVLFYLCLVWSLFQEVRRHGGNNTERMINEALLTSTVGFSIASISSSSIMSLRFQWFLFAFALAFLNYASGKWRQATRIS